jgi:hypothetical protein
MHNSVQVTVALHGGKEIRVYTREKPASISNRALLAKSNSPNMVYALQRNILA